MPLLIAAVSMGQSASAGDASSGGPPGRRHDNDVRVYTYVPPPPDLYESQAPYFYGRARIEVPGAVTLNTAPYACSLDGATFPDKASFVAHLQTRHRGELSASPDPFVVGTDGQVRFVP